MDKVELTANVMFVGDYFSLIHTVVLEEEYRRVGEGDEDFAVRCASEFLKGYYGWDVAAVSNEIGVMDDDFEFPDEWVDDEDDTEDS